MKTWQSTDSRRTIVAAPLSAMATLTPLVLLLLWQDILGDYLRQVATFVYLIAPRVTSSQNLVPPALASLARFDALGQTAWVFYGSLAAFSALAAIAVNRLWNFRRRPPDELWVWAFLLLWMLSNIPQYTLERPDVPHLVQRNVALFIALAVIGRVSMQAALCRGMLGKRIAAAAITMAVAVYGCAATAKHLVHGEGWGWTAASLHVQPQMLSNGVVFPSETPSAIAPLVEHVVHNSQPGEAVASLPYLPGFNFLAQRRMPSRHVYVLPEFMRPGLEESVLESLRCVTWVVYDDQQNIHGNERQRPASFMPQIDAYLRANFRPQMQAGSIQLLRRQTD